MSAISLRPRLAELLRRLGWFYSSALAVATASLWAFAELAEEVIARRFAPFDRWVVLGMHTQAHPILDRLALVAAMVGDVEGIIIMGALFGAWLLRRDRYLDAATLAAVLAGAGVLTYTLKLAFQQPRPALYTQLVKEVTFSFPTGHALNAFALFGFIAWWLVAQAPRSAGRWLAAAALVALAAAIAVSRVYLGVHWPTDVVAGAIVAIFWLTICLIGRHWIARRRPAAPQDTEAVPPK
ncbi:phosphatidylglycerophosphatase B [compost metagenome]